MESPAVWILLLLALFVGRSFADGKINDVQLVVESPGNRTYCNKMETVKWTGGFHECFFERKYKDNGQDLEGIVDRIMRHADACVEMSIRPCQPDFQGFKDIMNKIISQIKDYSEMYLSAIIKGRENYRDLECVEKILRLETYVKCFQTSLRSPEVSQKSFERSLKEGVSCARRANEGCSHEAKSTMSRIVHRIFGVTYHEETTTPPPPPTTPEPPPYRWYDYIIQPFVSAWQTVRSWFGW